jgi:hypothetical protein
MSGGFFIFAIQSLNKKILSWVEEIKKQQKEKEQLVHLVKADLIK